MVRVKISFVFIFMALFNVGSCPIPAIVPLVGGALAVGTAVYMGIKCRIDECCDNNWINCANASQALRETFLSRFYGQHIAAKSLLSAIDGYCSRDKVKSASPWKAVVLSLHGPTGVGKSHVSHLIAEVLFKNSMRSSFVHYFDLATDLRTEEDQSRLHDWILGNASLCSTQLFIFNEIDKADVKFSATIDKLHKFLDYGAKERDVDLTKLIFIFIGNLGTMPLVEDVTERYRIGQRREDISGRELELLLERAAFDQKAGLFRSEIVKRKLVDAFVPFLPLERRHVEQCVQTEINTRFQVVGEDGVVRVNKTFTPTEEEALISSIVDELEFEPDEEGERFFAVTGCKEVQRLVQKATYQL